MPEDDFDLDLDLDAAPAPPVAAAPAPAAEAAEAEAAKAPAEAAAPRRQVVAKERPSLGERVREPLAAATRAWPPVWGGRSFVLGLLALLLALVVVENWPPMRLSLLGLHADIPKAVVLLVDFAAGFGAAWLMLRRGPGRGTPSV